MGQGGHSGCSAWIKAELSETFVASAADVDEGRRLGLAHGEERIVPKKWSNSNDETPSTNRSGLLRFLLSFGACACVRRCALARALGSPCQRVPSRSARGSLRSPSLRAHAPKIKDTSGRKFHSLSDTNYDLAPVSSVFFVRDDGSNTVCVLTEDPPNSSTFRRTRGKWRRKTVTKACRTPESWTDLMTSWQVSETGRCVSWVPARN